MRTFFLLFCTSVFSFSSGDLLSQNSKIVIDADKSLTIDEIFEIIDKQTDYSFAYKSDMFKGFPRIKVKKGTIKTNTLLRQILSVGDFNVVVGANNTIIIKEKSKDAETRKAQGFQVSGTVTDQSDQPLPGANILEKGTTNGVTTDFDGKFSIDVSDSNAVLVVSYVGFESQEVNVDNKTSLTIRLIEDTGVLDDVIVVGYGSQKKKDITGAVSSVKAAQLKNLVVSSPTSVLQGQLAGVQVESFGGQPGAATNVFVRGIGSLTDSSPLYIIDGTFATTIDYVNPNDILSVEVLKDASSAAIYGSRASNGVVLVTTKRGSYNSDIKIDLTIRGGIETASKKLDYLNSDQFLDFRDEINTAAGFTLDRSLFTENGQLIYTDWQDEAFETGAIQDYGIAIHGGSETAKYFFSGNYFEQDGILVGSGFERINLRLNSEIKKGRLTINESVGLIQSKLQENNWFGFDGVPIPILRRNNPDNLGGFEAPDVNTSNVEGINNFALASLEDNLNTTRSLFGNLNVGYEIIDGLTVKLNLGIEYSNSFRSTFLPTYFMSPSVARFNDNQENDLTHIRIENLRTQIEPTLSYSKSFGDHNLDVVLGYSEIRGQFDVQGNYVINLPSDGITTTGAAGVDNIAGTVGSREIDGLISGFGRINYNYAGKYLFSGTIRKDASSKFADGSRSDVFPSFSLGWRISDEDFFPQDRALTDLKLRGGYGELGAQNIGNYLYQSTLNLTSQAAFGNAILPGFAQIQFANDGLQWETSSTVNFGLDLGFWNNKLTFSAEYYKKNVENLLVAVPIPSSNGTNIPVTQNAGELENSGLEFELNYRESEGDFKYQVAFNLGTLNSELTAVPAPFVGPSVNRGIQSVNIFRQGEEPGAFFGFVIDGVYDDQSQIDNDPNRANDPNRGNLAPGDFIKRDTDGDGDVDNDDQTVLGSPIPDFTYGLTFSGSYKKFDFSLNFTGVSGNEIYNQARAFSVIGDRGNNLAEILDRWTPQNTTGSVAGFRAGDPAGNARPSSFFVEDGSYLRLRNLTLGYDLTELINSDFLQRVRFSVTGQNLFVITDYKGYDPDVASTNGSRSNENSGFYGFRPTVNTITGRGIDIRAYPNSRSIICGLEISF